MQFCKHVQRETRANIDAHRNAQKEEKCNCKTKKKQYEEEELEESQDRKKKIMTCVNSVKEYTRSGISTQNQPL